MERSTNSALMRYAALIFADGLTADFLTPEELATRNLEHDSKKHDLMEAMGPFVFAEEFERVRGHCLKVIEERAELLVEFAGDLVEAHETAGKSGVREALAALLHELLQEIARTFMQIVDSDDGGSERDA